MSNYTKMSIILAIESVIIYIVGLVIKSVNKDFNINYILIMQLTLILAQITSLILQNNESKKQYTYYCDICKEEISYKDKTLNKIYVEQEYNKRKHVCELCDRSFRGLEKLEE